MGSHSQNVGILREETVKNPIDGRLSPGGSSVIAAAVANGRV